MYLQKNSIPQVKPYGKESFYAENISLWILTLILSLFSLKIYDYKFRSGNFQDFISFLQLSFFIIYYI